MLLSISFILPFFVISFTFFSFTSAHCVAVFTVSACDSGAMAGLDVSDVTIDAGSSGDGEHINKQEAEIKPINKKYRINVGAKHP